MDKHISAEQLNISEAVSMLVAKDANMLQFQVFKDEEKKDPMFAAFFILGEDGEAKEAIEEMTKLKEKWEQKKPFPVIKREGGMDVSYLIVQSDTEGNYDMTRSVPTVQDFMRSVKQYGIKKLLDSQKIVKRIEVPLRVPCLEKGDEDGGDP